MNSEIIAELAQRHTVEVLAEAIKLRVKLLAGDRESQLSKSTPEDLPLECLDFSQRAYNCLRRSRITKLSELRTCSREELLSIRGFGKRCLGEVEDGLIKLGCELSGEDRLAMARKLQQFLSDMFSPENLKWTTGYDHRTGIFRDTPYRLVYDEAVKILKENGEEYPIFFLESKGFTL